MNIVKVISEHKKTKRAVIIGHNKEGETLIQRDGDKFHSKVGFIEAIVRGPGGFLYTCHIPDPRPKEKRHE